jgi:zinc D-Ala-D-Ala dipeptidase
LKYFFIHSFFLLLFLSSCDFRPKNRSHHLKKRVVYVIADDDQEKKSVQAFADTSYLEVLFKGYNLVNIKNMDSTIQVDLRYADTSNFLKRNLYDGLRNAYLNCETALRVCEAQFYLKQIDPNLSLLILDASRPQHIQQMMWDSLKMHPDKKQFYLSKPEETSLHNYGGAIDVTIVNKTTGKTLDMGTEYDFFGYLAEPIYESRFLKSGELSKEAYENRLLLRKVMMKAKLNPITSEWWHFSICKKEEAAARFTLIK